jgi:hypothetical protein
MTPSVRLAGAVAGLEKAASSLAPSGEAPLGPLSEQCQRLADDVTACFREWGGFLDARLFNEALSSFNGGEAKCVRRLRVARGNLDLGHHTVQMHSENCGFIVTSMSEDTAAQESHLSRLLQLLPLRGWQWINIHHNQMRLVSICGDNNISSAPHSLRVRQMNGDR